MFVYDIFLKFWQFAQWLFRITAVLNEWYFHLIQSYSCIVPQESSSKIWMIGIPSAFTTAGNFNSPYPAFCPQFCVFGTLRSKALLPVLWYPQLELHCLLAPSMPGLALQEAFISSNKWQFPHKTSGRRPCVAATASRRPMSGRPHEDRSTVFMRSTDRSI